ncbi:MAG: hypothetical protein B7X10_00405, partial [Burkholderiales bacterium 21-58-4]
MGYGVTTVVGDIIGGAAYWPAVIARTAHEHRQLRQFIDLMWTPIPNACGIEFGCGYGRMLPVLGDYCERVIGYERDPELADIATKCYLNVRRVDTLAHVGEEHADLLLTYTVLQHMPEAECKSVIAEIRRIATGFVIMVEDGQGQNGGGNVWSRTPEQYSAWLGLPLIARAPRIGEDGRDRGN